MYTVKTQLLAPVSTTRWMCAVKLGERKKSKEVKKLLLLEPVNLMIIKRRLRWFGHVGCRDNNGWAKCCTTLEGEEIRQRYGILEFNVPLNTV